MLASAISSRADSGGDAAPGETGAESKVRGEGFLRREKVLLIFWGVCDALGLVRARRGRPPDLFDRGDAGVPGAEAKPEVRIGIDVSAGCCSGAPLGDSGPLVDAPSLRANICEKRRPTFGLFCGSFLGLFIMGSFAEAPLAAEALLGDTGPAD